MSATTQRMAFGKVTRSLDPFRQKLEELQEREHFENRRGEMFTYDFFERALGLPRTDPRFKTVMYQWRKFMLKTHGVGFIALANEGFRALEPGEQVGAAARKVVEGTRRMRTGKQLAEGAIATGKLLTHEKTNAEFFIVVSSNAMSQLRDASKLVLKQATAPHCLPPKRN